MGSEDVRWLAVSHAALVWACLFALGCSGETRVSLFAPAPGEPDAAMPDARSPDATPDAPTVASDAASDATPDARPDAAVGHLIHRYDFTGTGTLVPDLVGGADGVVLGGAVLDSAGGVVLDGNDDYVDLPNGLISSLTSVTFMVWLSYSGAVCWHRVFDFGSTDEGEGIVGHASSSIFVTPSICPANAPRSGAYAQMETPPTTEINIPSDLTFGNGRERHVALVIDGPANVMRFYFDAEFVGQATLRVGLSGIQDVNNWLGRSQWIQDNNLPGRYDEFRIYDAALSGADIALARSLGPDVVQ